MNLREQIVEHLIETLKQMEYPQPVLVTREPFDVEKLAITQYPALMVNFQTETREQLTMGNSGLKNSTMEIQIRGFVRGKELDTKRNELITGIEQALEKDRARELRDIGVRDTEVVGIEVIERLQPLAEISVTVEVTYLYRRTNP
jgi:hypothetical protein